MSRPFGVKTMKIKSNNYKKLNETLDSINGRADSHVFTGPQIRTEGEKIKKHLSQWFTLKEMKGISGIMESSSPVARAYKYCRVGNEANFVVNAKGEVFITAIAKVDLWEKDGGRTFFKFSDDEKKIIAEKAIETATRL